MSSVLSDISLDFFVKKYGEEVTKALAVFVSAASNVGWIEVEDEEGSDTVLGVIIASKHGRIWMNEEALLVSFDKPYYVGNELEARKLVSIITSNYSG